MNRNSIIGFILIAAIMIFYTVYMTPSKEELAEKKRIQDSIARVQKELFEAQQKAIEESEKAREEATIQPTADTVQVSSDNFEALKDKFAVFANSAEGSGEVVIVETDLVTYEIGTLGGFIKNATLKDYETYDSLPLKLFNPEHNDFGLTFFSNNRLINTSQLYFQPSGETPDVMSVNGEETFTISMRLYADAGEGQFDQTRYIEYVYTFRGNDYMFDVDVNIINLRDVLSINTSAIDLFWHADVLQQEQTVDQFNGSTIYYRYSDEDVDYLSESDDDEEEIKTRLKWVSFKQRFFSSTLVARDYFEGGNLQTRQQEPVPYDHYLKSMAVDLIAPYNYNGNTNIPLSVYLGPNKFYTLKSYAMGLERQIPIGWSFFLMAWINEFIVIPVFDWLGGYGWNYGIVILVLTILLKIVLFPIAYKTYMSSAKMRVLKPEVDEINKKYPKKEDAMKKQQAVMALYKSAGANPASGCVPMLLQLPILIAMFRFFPASIELRQQSFLWAHDLSTYDSIAQLPFSIPFYGDHVSLFTLLMTVSTVLYTYLNNQMMGQQSNQLPGMKTMMYLMPIMFLGIFNNYASGLSYYYFLANIITFGQMFVFRRAINEDKLRAKIEATKKKPAKKKSGFQKRLEEAAKKRGYKP
jgi:YidC/Oxa1 family membrane protein insertase